MFCQVPVGYNQMFCQAKMKLKLRVNCMNHAVLYWLREMDIIVKINVMKKI